MERLRRPLAAALHGRVAALLEPRRRMLEPVAADLRAARAEAEALRARLTAAERTARGAAEEARALGLPFRPEMTIDAAWRRHPGAPGVFARHHLPGCDACAVRFDETLAEAAAAYGIDTESFLADLNALLAG